ncbi:hypothetical protein B0A55_00236 [Friedmanniomyces simplex]|uniref:Uncharacterized protein n=1 Tax=Friedmanniomyces simplex TaxID=329884 RepID=A0A4U0Y893_9PEZI|nr:hypothetical protein B0A55_00236 [Friedmanniomyces simplex]
MALNYKSLPYRTVWIEYPDLTPTLSSLGLPPNAPGTSNGALYSSPALRLPDGTYVMDSLRIAHALEKLQPEPSLYLDHDDDDDNENEGYVDRAQTAVLAVQKALMPIAAVRIPGKILRPASQEYFRSTRAKRFGMSLEDLAESDLAGENAWKAAEPGLEALRALLREHRGEGPYVMGTRVSFADFVIAGFWRFLQVLDEGGDLFGRGIGFDGVFMSHFEACKGWLERDD